MKKIFALLPVALLLNACQNGEAYQVDVATESASVVDTLFPIPEATERFLASIEGPPPRALTGGAASLEELFDRLVAAYDRRDIAALNSLSLTRAEFGYLYYPLSPYPEPPYELDPEFVWYLVAERGTAGANRALERFAGRGSTYRDYECPGAAKAEGGGLLWGPCLVTVHADGKEDSYRLANAVLERDGRFKLVGFDNGL